MATLYKLTDAGHRTRAGRRNSLKWGEGVTHSASGSGSNLCSDGVIHAYDSPAVAILMNAVHAAISNPVLWESEGHVVVSDGLKVGAKALTTIRIIEPPQFSTGGRVSAAIEIAMLMCATPAWRTWADRWLSGEDRTADAADAAETEAWAEEAWAGAVWAAKAAAWAARAAEAAAVAGTTHISQFVVIIEKHAGSAS